MATEVAFKVDVCNHRALHRGLPNLLRTLEQAGAPASLFVAFGPDNSGRAIRRLFRPGFLRKMLRTRAPRMYGLRTLFLGTLLPAPLVGESGRDLLREAARSGHPVGLHGFDHVGWQDGIGGLGSQALRILFERAIRAFEDTLERPPAFTGAPGWQVTPASLQAQDRCGFAWASDCRAGEPFYPLCGGQQLRTLQIPTSLPTSDELLGAGIVRTGGLADWYTAHLVPDRLNVIGLHAEAEGIHFGGWLREWLGRLRGQRVAFVALPDVAERERPRAPLRRIEQRELPGRSGAVACPEKCA